MKIKKAIVLLGAMVMALNMVSCGGNEPVSGGAATSSCSHQEGTKEIIIDDMNLTEAIGKNFKAQVAGGWKLMSASEIGSMTDDADFLVKGDHWDASAPYLQISSTTGNFFDWKQQLKDDPNVKYIGDYGVLGIPGVIWRFTDKIAGAEIGGKIVTVTPQNGIDMEDETVMAMIGTICWANDETAETTAVSAAETTVTVSETASSAAETTETSAETTETTAATETTASAAGTATTAEGALPVHEVPTPGVHKFTLPADCPYDFDDISFHAKNYYENHTNNSVQFAEAEKLNGNILTIHLYDIVDFWPLDYQYYYVDYHDLKGTDIDGNPVDLESTEQTVWFPGTALNSVDFGESRGAALYLGKLDADGEFGKAAVQALLSRPENAAYAEKYTFIRDIPEDNYISPVGGAKPNAEVWMLVPRPTNLSTQINVLNQNAAGDPVGLVYHSAHGSPILLACNAGGWNDCEVTFISEGDGVSRTFKPYITKDTGVPACTQDYIKILN
ncbi:MAG: hypothetical protein IK130_00485 [Oscillospiraceae bacterium]|nr:hypothetical protein [Oscillospiraceae bacterium]